MSDERLEELTIQLAKVSESLEKLLATDSYLIIHGASSTTSTKALPPRKALLRAAEGIYQRRRWRSLLFENAELFGEPAWDILLDLYIAELRDRRVSVTDACIGSGVPSTTALRWVMLLERAGLVIRKKDPLDARRAYLELSRSCHAKMEEFCERELASHR